MDVLPADSNGKAFQTSTSSSPTSTSDNGNEPSSFFGNQGPTPIIPAFVLTGVLVAVLIMICAYRRVLVTRGIRPRGADGGPMMVRYGPFGMSFVQTVAAERAARAKKELGPKPELWDAFTKGGSPRFGDEKGVLWKDMKVRVLYFRVFRFHKFNNTAIVNASKPSFIRTRN